MTALTIGHLTLDPNDSTMTIRIRFGDRSRSGADPTRSPRASANVSISGHSVVLTERATTGTGGIVYRLDPKVVR